MAGRGRPKFKPTAKQRDRVKLLKADGWSNERIAAQLGVDPGTLAVAFASEIEFGADAKRIEVIEAMQAAAKKGNASAGKWLHDRFATARAAEQVASREMPAAAPEPRPEKLGKKQLQKEAAGKVGGKFAVPEPPKLH